MCRLFRLSVVVAAVSLLAGPAFTQEGMQMPKPGPQHEKLKAMEGEYECTMDMMGAKSPCKSTMKMGLGGFWLTEKFDGDFGGMKFEGRGTMGYCPILKKYTMSWIDSMSPSGMNMTGDFSDANTMTMTGDGPNHEGKMSKFKSVTVRKDADNADMTMYEIKDGKDEKMFSIAYKRKK